jgi:hypothetical protein
MERRRLPHAAFLFPSPDMTPQDTPEELTPTLSQFDSRALSTTTTTPNMVAEPRIDGIACSVDNMPMISRFFHLLDRSKALVYAYGPHTTYASTTVFSQAPAAHDTPNRVLIKDLAISLATAQDCAGSAQVEGPAKDDLAVFNKLWDTTIVVLETITVSCELHHENFGWGVVGLCAGYIGHSHWREESSFVALKGRLHDALKKMPSMDSRYRRNKSSVASAGGMIECLAKENRAIHVCGNLLLQQFRREEWARIRWYHAVAVAQSWIANLGLEDEVAEKQNEAMG